MTSAEEKLRHILDRNKASVARYRKKHNIKILSVSLTSDRFDLLDKKLKQLGMTKKQFIENAIDNLE